MPGQIRIIAGKWRRRRLPVPDAEGLRPTTDRIRETLFNWLQPYLADARCLDLFAGTGALGFEAASRGAACVTLVDRDPLAVAGLERNARMLGADGVRIRQSDVSDWMRSAALAGGEPWDVVFVDPPFGRCDLTALLERLEQHRLVHAGSLVYVESGVDDARSDPPAGWRVHRERRTRHIRYYLAIPPGGAA
ncbi:MAG: 16S rRNA (guanine(966)-N(2))-methyltransferase RsmD [Gammaproteobacteria bacterium]|nr:16S rRNA (guanine(966)-N(2))-methyltransferase RsmD [Gammaproteobacteria bacterium]